MFTTLSQPKPKKNYYRENEEYRQKVLERSKEEYKRHRRPTFKLTEEEKQLLKELNCYPNLMPGWRGGLGTSQSATSLAVVEVDGKRRVKGAIWLSEQIEKIKEKHKKGS